MTTNWRALCAELTDELADFQLAVIEAGVGWACPDTEALIDRARAALALANEPAEPPLYARQTGIGQWEGADHPSGPWRKVLPAALARWGHQPAPPAEGPTVMEIIELADEIEAAELGQVDLVRAALARWGHQPAPPAEGEQRHPTPVPVAERLPGPEDCDAGGRCWAWDWLAEKWCLCDRTSACHGFDYWLPAHALPLPAGEVELNAE